MQINVRASSTGWYDIGTLPSELRPSEDLRFTYYDNNQLDPTKLILEGMLKSTGVLRVYIFSDLVNKDIVPTGVLTYFT